MAELFAAVKDALFGASSEAKSNTEVRKESISDLPNCPTNQMMHSLSKVENYDTIQSVGVPTWMLTDRGGITRHPSYHGSMRGWEAENKLRQQGHTCYLTRLGKRSKLIVSVLKVRSNDTPIVGHFKICISNKNGNTTYEIVGTENEFEDVFELLEFYKNKPISDEVDGIGSFLRGDKTTNAESSESDNYTDYHYTTTTEAMYDQTSHSDAELMSKRGTLIKLHRSSRDDIDINYYPAKQESQNATPPKRKKRPTVKYQKNYRVSQTDLENPQWKTKNIEQHPSYCGSMTGVEAEKVLMQQDRNCYLTRHSKSRKKYTLSVQREGRVYHFSINITGKDKSIYEIKGSSKSFKTGFEMLEFYQRNQVSIAVSNIGEPIRQARPVYPPQDTSLEDEQENDIQSPSSVSISSSAEDKDEELLREKMKQPSLHNLTLIKWEDEKGQKKKLKILEKVGVKWHYLGILLGQTMPVLESYRHMAIDDNQRCGHVFYQWLENGGPPEYSQNWEGVYTLLNDADHGSTAEELKRALASKGIQLA